MSADHLAESIARRTNRRAFLRRAATSVFAFSAVGAAAGLKASLAFGDGPCPDPGQSGGCVLNGLQYCTAFNPNLCATADCPSSGNWSCHVDKTIAWPSTGCWCTKVTYHNCGGPTAYYGYYKCCDCSCRLGSNSPFNCVCSQFIYLCRTAASARPDNILCC